MTRLQRAHLAEDGSRPEHMAEVEEIVDSAIIDVELEAGNVAQCRDFGCEGIAASLLGDEQRLDPKRVARERERFRVAVPDRRRIHALEAQPGVVAPAQVRREQGFDVAPGAELVAGLQLATQVEVIDDLAVADDRIASVGTGDRLMAVLGVDNAEPAHAEPEIAVDERACVVGSAVN